VLLLLIFGFPQNQKKWKWENTKKYIKKIFERNPKIITVRKGCWNAEKRIEIDWGDSKLQELKFWQYIFDWWEPWGQEKFNLRKKSKKSDVYGLK
jgi:hypothetical protein